MKVALDAVAHVLANIRWQSIREQHSLSESTGFLPDMFPGAIDDCPHARGARKARSRANITASGVNVAGDAPLAPLATRRRETIVAAPNVAIANT